MPSSIEFDRFWTQKFSTIVKASSSSNPNFRLSAESILAKGASSLLASSTSVASLGVRAKSTLPCAEWTKSILSLENALSLTQATVLSSLVSRSLEARQLVLHHVKNQDTTKFNEALELPLKTVLEVAVVREEKVDLPEPIIKRIIESVLSREQVEDSSLSVVDLLVAASPSAASLIRSTLEESLATTARDGYKASIVGLVGKLAQKNEELQSILEGYVNGSFEGLTRKFVDAKEDESVEKALSIALGESVYISLFSRLLAH